MSSARDFGEDAKNEIFKLIDEVSVTEGDWWGGFLDSLSDKDAGNYLPFMMLAQDDMDIATYHRNIFDSMNTSKAEIETIWKDVAICEANHVNKISELEGNLYTLISDYSKLREMINTKRDGGFLLTQSPSDVSNWILENFCETEARILEQERYFDYFLQEEIAELDIEYAELWDTYTDKQLYYQDYYDDVLEIMGIEGPKDIQFVDLPTGVAGRKIIDPNNPKTFIIELDTNNVASASRESILMDIVHEARHGYQWEVRLDYEARVYFADNPDEDTFSKNYEETVVYPTHTVTYVHNVTYDRNDYDYNDHPFTGDTTAQAWVDHVPYNLNKNPVKYVESTLEWDAFNFSGIERAESFLSGKGFDINQITPVHSGSW